MGYVSSNASTDLAGVSRPMVKALFIASCLLSFVSWYTTYEGMSLYLSVWFSALASIGVQTALVLVAWLISFSSSSRMAGRRPLLIGVYIVTAIISIKFSYTSLYTWFSARERPATVERRLYDTLNDSAGQTQRVLTSAIGEQQKHVLALQEMTEAEKNARPHLSRRGCRSVSGECAGGCRARGPDLRGELQGRLWRRSAVFGV